MVDVVLDANALIMPFQFNINLDSELERLFVNPDVYVPTSVLDELEILGRKDAQKLASKYDTIEVNSRRDEGVIEAVQRLDGILVTNDKVLKNRVRKMGYPVAFLRSRSHLEVIGEYF
ncbi:MAG: PIN domain-containing protein [Thermoplasmatota archaeon]